MTISSPLIDVASLPDVSTTAGKIADLKARRIDAASPVGRAAQKKVRTMVASPRVIAWIICLTRIPLWKLTN